MTAPSSFLHEFQQHSHPHFSPTRIRNLIKHFTRTRSHHSMNPHPSPPPNSTRHGRVLDASQRRPHKRQVRRRLHTGRPYQDRLLNAAQARSEIVSALKSHRASMKLERQQQEANPQHYQLLQPPCFVPDAAIMSQTNLVSAFSFSSRSHPNLSVPNPSNYPAASRGAPPPVAGNLKYNLLPNRTLGLNLNFKDFNNLDAALYLDNGTASFYPRSSPSWSFPSLSVSTDQEVPSVAISRAEGTSALADAIDSVSATRVPGGKHTILGDKGMAEIRSQGERCQAEWSDTVNLAASTSATEIRTEDNAAYPVFDEAVEFPDWFSANERCFEPCSEEFVSDPTLPCMEIGDIEGMGEEWLA